MTWLLCMQLGEAALVRIALHAPTNSPVTLGCVLAGTLDFRAPQEAVAMHPDAYRCIQVRWPPSASPC
jgi:hypothetical protein